MGSSNRSLRVTRCGEELPQSTRLTRRFGVDRFGGGGGIVFFGVGGNESYRMTSEVCVGEKEHALLC